MREGKEAAKTGIFTPGEILLSRDGRRRWQVQEDGSLRRIEDQAEGELEEVAAQELKRKYE